MTTDALIRSRSILISVTSPVKSAKGPPVILTKSPSFTSITAAFLPFNPETAI